MQIDEMMDFLKEDRLYDLKLPERTQLEEAFNILENEIPELRNTPYLHETLVYIHEMGREINSMNDLDEAMDEIINGRSASRRLPTILRIFTYVGLAVSSISKIALQFGLDKMKELNDNNISLSQDAITGSQQNLDSAIDKINGALGSAPENASIGGISSALIASKNTFLNRSPAPTVTYNTGIDGALSNIASKNIESNTARLQNDKQIETILKWANRGLWAIGIAGLSVAVIMLGWRLVNYFSARSGQKVYYSDMTLEEKRATLKGLLVETEKFIAKNKDRSANQQLEQTRNQLKTLLADVESQMH